MKYLGSCLGIRRVGEGVSRPVQQEQGGQPAQAHMPDLVIHMEAADQGVIQVDNDAPEGIEDRFFDCDHNQPNSLEAAAAAGNNQLVCHLP